MEKRCFTNVGGPPAMGPYSPAVAAGNLLFVSGQGPVKPDGSGVLRGTFEEEARLTLSNVKAVVEGAGSSLDKVVKVTAFLADMDRFAEFNKIYKEYFGSDCPARSCIQAARLPGGFQVEVEAIALLPGK